MMVSKKSMEWVLDQYLLGKKIPGAQLLQQSPSRKFRKSVPQSKSFSKFSKVNSSASPAIRSDRSRSSDIRSSQVDSKPVNLNLKQVIPSKSRLSFMSPSRTSLKSFGSDGTKQSKRASITPYVAIQRKTINISDL